MFEIKRDIAEGNFVLTLSEGIYVINIFNIDGSLVLEKASKPNQSVLKFSLNKGFYILRVFDILTNKIHIEKITSP